MILYIIVLFIPGSFAYLQHCQEYAKINQTYYNMTCFNACEKFKKNIYLYNCSELYNSSENFLNLCFAERCSDPDILDILNTVYYDINNLLNTESCSQTVISYCNLNNNNGINIAYAFIFVGIIIFISLLICSFFNCIRLWQNYRLHTHQLEEPLVTY